MTHDPAPTRKDGQGGSRVPPTRRDDTPSSPRSWGLPPGLAAAYPDASPQQTLGGEADIYLVTASTGEQRVLKLYREGIRVDAKVRQLLPGLTQKLRHAVSVFEIGQDDGRDYEIQEYLPLGRIDAARNWSGEQIATIVKQITETLAALHAQGIVHRDLKPGNILLRDDNAPTIAITDFGISRILDQTRDFTDRRHGTVSYAPPEAQIDMPVVSAAWDWWSLGVLVRELASDAPIAAVSDPVLQFRIVTGDIDLSMVADQRCRLLCQGLLQRDPGRRWTATEIRAWLVGDSPPAPPDPSIADSRLRDDGTPTVWPEVTFTGEPELAEAIGKDWEGAAAYFCPGPDLVTPDWEPRLHRLLPNVDRGRHQRLSEILRGRESAPVQLVRFIQALDPQRPVGYGGYRLDPPRLA
ncbi:MAG: protein kinase domain-containing protein, partial [Stackebrandtia sp.]